MTWEQLERAKKIENEINLLKQQQAELIAGFTAKFYQLFPKPTTWEKDKEQKFGYLKDEVCGRINEVFEVLIGYHESQLEQL